MDNFQDQCLILDPVPITYFVQQPTSGLNKDIVKDLSSRFSIEWELHPDSLDEPDLYGENFSNQIKWFQAMIGKQARLVRNHGFLNDGYWGHLSTWCKHGVKGSSNIPGFDGHVLNGSLLPARISLAGELTEHWSLLTLFGDGMIFAKDWTDEQAAEKVREEGMRILGSGVPGVMCLNLHPANISKTQAMHKILHELIDEGFIAMTFGDLLAWFQGSDKGECDKPVLGTGQSEKPENRFFRLLASLRRC